MSDIELNFNWRAFCPACGTAITENKAGEKNCPDCDLWYTEDTLFGYIPKMKTYNFKELKMKRMSNEDLAELFDQTGMYENSKQVDKGTRRQLHLGIKSQTEKRRVRNETEMDNGQSTEEIQG